MKQINKIPKINTRDIGPHNSCWEKNMSKYTIVIHQNDKSLFYHLFK